MASAEDNTNKDPVTAAEDPLAATGEDETGDPNYQGVIKLEHEVVTRTNEEDEDVRFKIRAKLFRFEKEAKEWKERGTGEVRLLESKSTKKIRLVMRRDKTLKVCANHYLTSDMKLAPNVGSDRSWVWSVAADVSDGEPNAETLAIRFANSENAQEFKKAFENAQAQNKAASGDAAKQQGEDTKKTTEIEPAAAASASAPSAKADDAAAAASSSDDQPQAAVEL